MKEQAKIKCPECGAGKRDIKERYDIKFQFDRSADYYQCKLCHRVFWIKDGTLFSDFKNDVA